MSGGRVLQYGINLSKTNYYGCNSNYGCDIAMGLMCTLSAGRLLQYGICYKPITKGVFVSHVLNN